MKGLFPLLLDYSWQLAQRMNKYSLMCHIDYDNRLSRKSHERIGFKHISTIKSLSIPLFKFEKMEKWNIYRKQKL